MIEKKGNDFRIILDRLAKDRLISLKGKEGLENKLKEKALTRYLEKKSEDGCVTPEGNLPIKDILVNDEILYMKGQELIQLGENRVYPEDVKAFAGIISISERKTLVWLPDGLKNKGIKFGTAQIADDHAWDHIQEMMESVQRETDDHMFDLSVGLSSQVNEVVIPAGVTLEKPLVIRITNDSPPLFFPQIIIIHLGKFARAKLLLEVDSLDNAENQNVRAVIISIRLEEKANLDFVETQCISMSDWYLPFEKIKIGKDAILNRFIMDIGGKLNKRFFSANLDEIGGQAWISGVYLLKDGQRYIYDTHQNHLASDTRTDLLFRGVLEGCSSAQWKGNIFINQGIRGADGYQMNNNLLLSDNSRAESLPSLDILSDDVKCSHGATMSSIDPDQLFYLQSRGVNTNSAANLVKAGFIESAIDRINDKNFKEIALGRINLGYERIYK